MRKSNQRDLTPVSYIIGTLFYKHHPRKYKLDRRAVKIFENRKITLRLFQSGTATAGGGQFWVFLGVKFRAGKFRKTRATPENRSSATLHTPRGRQRTEAAKLSARVRLFELLYRIASGLRFGGRLRRPARWLAMGYIGRRGFSVQTGL